MDMKRTPLKRGKKSLKRTPLKRSKTRLKRTKLGACGKKTRAVMVHYTPHHLGVFCEACRGKKPPVDRLSDVGHHYIRRGLLTAEEINMESMQLFLCTEHHNEFHFSKHTSGLRFYRKYNLVETIKKRCNNDARLMKWLAGQAYKLMLIETMKQETEQ